LIDATVLATNAATGKEAGSGRTYAAPTTNPRVLPLPAGKYNVVVRALGISGETSMTFDGLVLAKGQTLEKVADFSTGELSITVLRNGQLSDATVAVYPQGTRQQVAGGRTYAAASSNPKILSLTAGVYDVEIGSVEMRAAAPQRFAGVTIKPAERVALKHEYQSGILRVGAKNGAQLIDAVVSVTRPGERAQIAGGRTYADAKSNPASFVLPPGDYQISATPVGPQSKARRETKLQVGAGGTAEWIADFAP
jgi:hypothetical protein